MTIPSSPSPAITRFPSPIKPISGGYTDEEKITLIAAHFKEIIEILELDLTDESLSQTPLRMAKMYVEEIFWGLKEENFPKMSFFKSSPQTNSQGNFILTKASFTSFCEHHFVPMMGVAYVAYIPHQKWIGLSNIPCLVRFFAGRPQLQERLTAQIADSLSLLLETEDVALTLHARHTCVMARGPQDEHNQMMTSVLRGQFQENEKIRQEFFEGINRLDFAKF